MLHKSIFFGFLFNLLVFSYADPGPNCDRTSVLIGLESEFTMVQHQLRGHLKIIDDCSFRVSGFDMISGSDVHWWGASGSAVDNLTEGFIVSDHKLNDTYKNASFVVNLMKNITWDMIQYWQCRTDDLIATIHLSENESTASEIRLLDQKFHFIELSEITIHL